MQRVFLWAAILLAVLFALKIDGNIFLSRFAHTVFQPPSDLNCFRTNGALIALYPSVTAADAAKSCVWLPKGGSVFMYPPPFLLLAVPLAWVTPLWAYILWNATATSLLVFAARVNKFPSAAIALGLIAPPSLYCMAIAQTGEITSALLLLSLGLASLNPILAGIFAGCLVIKPQFGILLPVCYLASRNWRAFAAAACSSLFICAVSAWLFGMESWRHFFGDDTATMRLVLNQPWPQPFQAIMVSVFMALRSLGASLPISYASQMAVTLGVVGACWAQWSPGAKISAGNRLVLTLCLVPLATPYAYTYDTSALALALAAQAARTKWQNLMPFAAFMFVSSFYIVLAMFSFLTGGALLLILAAYLWKASNGVHAEVAAPAGQKLS